MDRIDALRMPVDVAEMRRFSGVARQRSIAPSPVTVAVKQLEDELGTTLITRSMRRLVFTHEGLALPDNTRRIVGDRDAAVMRPTCGRHAAERGQTVERADTRDGNERFWPRPATTAGGGIE